jgi:hypothetical protein
MSEKEGSDETVCDAVDGLLVDGCRRRTGRLGVCGGASSIVVSEEPLLAVEDRDRDCGVDAREAISCQFGRMHCGNLEKWRKALCASEGLTRDSGVYLRWRTTPRPT